MRQDIIVGVAASALIHAGLFVQGILFPSRPPVASPPLKAVVRLLEMPKLEPDDPPPSEPTNEPVKPIDFAPATLPDVPQATTDISFVQKLQPPMPDNVMPATNLMAVPDRRSPSEFQKGPVFDPSSLDQQPVAQVRTPPPYPSEMRRLGVSGEVVVDFIVDASGQVRNAHAIRSTQREFEPAAEQGVSRWKFKPGRKGGRAVNTHMQVPIVFSLNDS